MTKGGVADVFYWRTLVNMNYQSSTIDKVTFDAVEYPVIDREVCLWLPASTDDTKVYSFGVGDKTEQVSGYQVSAGKHDNDMTIGGNNNVARIGTQGACHPESRLRCRNDGADRRTDEDNFAGGGLFAFRQKASSSNWANTN